jgi:probable O-glycosylation ligase (exosortase A-associated)
MNPHQLNWGFARTIPVALLAGAAVLIGLPFAKDRKRPPWCLELALIFFLAIYVTVTTFFAMVPDNAWVLWEKYEKILLMTVVPTLLIYGRERIRALLLVIALSIGFYGFKGGIWTLATGGLYRVRGPRNSFIESNNDLGLALVMVIPLLLSLARGESRKWVRFLLNATALLCALSTIFTYSRGALVGLAAILLFILFESKKKVLLAILMLSASLFIVKFAPQMLFDRAETIQSYDEDASAMSRLQAWSVSWNLALARPLMGGGFQIDNLSDLVWMGYANREYDKWNQTARAAHSIYFQFLGEHGFVAFGSFLLLLLSALRTLQQIKRQAVKDSSLAWVTDYAQGIQIGIIGYMVAGAFLSLAYFDLFYSYIAITVVLKREVAGHKSASMISSMELAGTPATMQDLTTGRMSG